tara:strand:+ start:4758 stop:5264 length:507 start_codon:yes stop_codon:yes gene_type:complete
MAEYKGLSAELKEANLAHGEYADKLAAAIIKWVSMQTFTITEMTADVEVTRIETTGDIPVNTSPETLMGPHGPVIGILKKLAAMIPGASSILDPLEAAIKKATEGVSKGGSVLPALKMSKDGADGGQLIATGKAYIGPPAAEVEDADNVEPSTDVAKIQLLEEDIQYE